MRGKAPKDYEKAVFWYRKAANAADAAGMKDLGTMYENGWGVQQNKQQAIVWYRQAAKLGNEDANAPLRLGEKP
jgi:TPR repeat protein